MSSLNRVQLIGHLGRDPEIRNFDNGGMVANATLATTERWKDKQTGTARGHRVASPGLQRQAC